jgi:hypothetical protein
VSVYPVTDIKKLSAPCPSPGKYWLLRKQSEEETEKNKEYSPKYFSYNSKTKDSK